MGTCRLDGEVMHPDAASVDSHPIQMDIDAAPDAPPLPCDTTGLTCAGGTATTFMCGSVCIAKCTSTQSFANAQNACSGWQGRLAEIPDAATETCINAHVASSSWIGLTQAASQPTPADGWTWNNTTPLTYTHWASGKPDDGGGGESNDENCAHIEQGGAWDDENCSNGRVFFCQR